MKTIVYVDGFNLYYGALRGTAFKWLNLNKLCHLLLPKNEIVNIKYFTAAVSARPHDPDQPIRQQIYLRALKTLPSLEIIYGHFLAHEILMPRADNPAQLVKVIKTEEKGSDVNLAAHLINDGHRGRYDVAVLITNDSDLLEPVKMVRHELNLPVGILNPQRRPSWVLKQHASFIKKIRPGVLRASQFPAQLRDATGHFRKPATW
ncbi:MAG: NYN domain-containing protein [Chloroflexi bacterium]|nr:MAG: NYN domain-containing protein [Chloroflexota bacterium]